MRAALPPAVLAAALCACPCVPWAAAQEPAAPRWSELKGPCRQDAMDLCQSVQRQGMLMKCLIEHEASLTAPCREKVSAKRLKNKQFRSACAEDMARLCGSVEPGQGRKVACILERAAEVSENCRASMPDILSGSDAPLPEPAAPGIFPWRAEATAVARLLSGTTEGAAVDGLLDKLQRAPEDLDAQKSLRREVLDLYLESLREMQSAGRPDPPGSQPSLRRDAYFRLLIRQFSGKGIIQNVCLEGQSAFESGKYLLARDRFAVCGLLGPRQPWFRKSLDVYGRTLDGVAGRSEVPALAHSYFMADKALGAMRWQTARDMLGPIVGHYLKQGDPGGRLPELQNLDKRLSERIAVEKNIGLEGYDQRLQRTRTLVESDPARAVNELEALICMAHLYTQPMAAQRAKKLLLWAYSLGSVRETLRQAQTAYAAGNSSSTARLLVQVLEEDPGNRDALALVKRRESPDPKVPGTPERDTLQAEAYYNRGVQAYLDGDLSQAQKEWRSSLQLDPKMEKSRKALERAMKEMKLSKTQSPTAPRK